MSRTRQIIAAVITAAALTGGVAWGTAASAGASVTHAAQASYGQDSPPATYFWG
jgi:hypothetical protein